MSIEVKVPKEIKEYREKILMGLNFRQLICAALALIIGFVVYFFLLKFMNSDIAGYILIVTVFPIFAFGFYRKDGFTFEQYLRIRFRHYWSTSQRTYKTELNLDKMKGANTNGIYNKKQKKTKERKAEAERFKLTKKEEKRRSKKIRTAIKEAGAEHKRAKQEAKKTAKKTKATNHGSEYNSI